MTDAQVRILTLIEKGRHFYQSGEWLEARRCWQEVLRIDPHHPQALFLLQQLPYSHHPSGHDPSHPNVAHASSGNDSGNDPPAHVPPNAAPESNTGPDLEALFDWKNEKTNPAKRGASSHEHLKSVNFAVCDDDEQFFDDSFLSAPPSSFVARISQLAGDPTPPLGHNNAWSHEQQSQGWSQSDSVEAALKPPLSSDSARALFEDLDIQQLAQTSSAPLPGKSRERLPAWDPSLTETNSSPRYPSYNNEPQALEGSSPSEQHPEMWSPTPSPPRDERDMLLAVAEDLYETEDFEGALEMLEILKGTGHLSEIAQRLHDRCKHFLQKEYVSQFADATQRPRLNLSVQQLGNMELDHRAGFLLSQIDGRTSLKDLLLLSNLAEFDFLRIIHQLMQKGIIVL